MEAIVLSLRVNGMTYQGCEEQIHAAVERLPGVRHVSARHERAEVRAALDPTRSSHGGVRAAIETAGYEVAP